MRILGFEKQKGVPVRRPGSFFISVCLGCGLFGFCTDASAQQDIFITVSAPPASVGSEVPEPKLPVSPKETVAPEGKAASEDKMARELLRDPFWPVGYFPAGWAEKDQSDPNQDAAGWKEALAKVSISGTSRLGGRTVAIINGELKGAGDLVTVSIGSRSYRWRVVAIDGQGRVQFKQEENSRRDHNEK